jgi:hypothetical protein
LPLGAGVAGGFAAFAIAFRDPRAHIAAGQDGKPDMPPKQPTDKPREDKEREDADLDEALEETFPASDPIAPMRRGEDD